MNTEKLKSFILKASRATYASGDASLQQKQPDGSTNIVFEDGPFKYQDNYFGGEPYGGREVIFLNNKPIWMMVYYGRVYPGVENTEVYIFLVKSLSNSTLDMPYRGPVKFEEGLYRYENSFVGGAENFSGTEKIYKVDKLVYEASYLGGEVDK